jgi:L-cystine uptake protein TcyP (sodium:dicarboxylate symporter family)
MKIKVNNNFKAIFSISVIITLIGAYFKIMHWGYSQPILMVGLLLTLAYIIIGIIEVNNSNKIGKLEKVIWTISFIFLCFITALFYLFFNRKRIVQ